MWIRFSLLLFIGIAACSTRNETFDQPKQVLTEYIQRSFNVTQSTDKAKLLELLTGDAKNRLSMWSDEQFIESWVNSKRKFSKLKIHDQKNLSAQRVLITYELEFEDMSKGRHMKFTQLKSAILTQAENNWKINEVRSVKELIEYKDELSLP